MPSPSRGGGPAAVPKYQRIAAALRRDLDRAARTPGGRLPSERSLAARYQVNRQTIRAALQHLREGGLVVTGRRGSRPAVTAEVLPTAADPVDFGPASPAPGPTRSWVTVVTVPPSIAVPLGMSGGERTLVHHRREQGRAGETLRHAVTYFSPDAVARTPELAACRNRAEHSRDADPAPLRGWLERVSAAGRVAETITMTRTVHPPAPGPACGLTVRRTVQDPSGRLLAVTDLAFPTWDHLTFHRDRRHPAVAGFRVL
ncbi:GntR family transcriptional regulator [Streptomyces sp. NPDC058874]|uniref:GntR family transcriptional regulator n=1 Tax=unclassified Streptomyces TaxID=2593676 RepID=UPI003699B748